MKSPAVSPGIPRDAEHQALVDTHFHSRVTQWRDVYEQQDVEGAIYRKRLDIVLRWIDELAIPTGEKVLEIGCGAGRCTVALAQRGYLIHAMDSIEGMAGGFQPSRQAEGMDLQPEEFLPLPAFRSINLSQRGCHHRRVVTYLR